MTPRTVAEHLADVRRGGRIAGADRIGEAAAGGLLVRVGLWVDGEGSVVRARYLATTCAALIAYAEAACALAEAPGAALPDAARLRRAVRGVHPIHHGRADLVALALARALQGSRQLAPTPEPT
ncbi:hypothetical protein [Anaeromyxobacter diazotrophicus]|uniref:NIF system FeS cluster assembly NifU N-terminal domain-containing protein n=1 Tax=Anaeromyxobacter diazotrophicus TaxID=2590199 RepID=A0A7I9VRM7_9BACT|nr:hypothetical protein [Anaeromyxobacter diazotrophicus]GEJ59094.1 hypothetical protein AMYX_38350 [Anaeromyxobacter diazotrophicus]